MNFLLTLVLLSYILCIHAIFLPELPPVIKPPATKPAVTTTKKPTILTKIENQGSKTMEGKQVANPMATTTETVKMSTEPPIKVTSTKAAKFATSTESPLESFPISTESLVPGETKAPEEVSSTEVPQQLLPISTEKMVEAPNKIEEVEINNSDSLPSNPPELSIVFLYLFLPFTILLILFMKYYIESL